LGRFRHEAAKDTKPIGTTPQKKGETRGKKEGLANE
jgi:hypothetical protein